MLRKLALILILALVLNLALAACSLQNREEKQGLSILTSFLPMYIFTANIVEGAEGIDLNNLAAPESGCLHDYTLLPADMKKLEQADVFIINGAGMEGFMDQVARESEELLIVNAAAGIDIPELDLEAEDDHDEDHEHEHEENPHVWLSIPLAIRQVENISRGLQAADPDNAALYDSNAVAYIEKLEILYARMQSELATVDRREIITFHEAFPYFAYDFDLEIVGIINREPGSEPTAAELAATIELIREKGIRALFAEPQYPLNIAQTIAGETGAEIYILDPIATGELDKGYYELKMEENLQVLLEALKD